MSMTNPDIPIKQQSRKNYIVSRALAGLEVDTRLVATTNRARTAVQLRHTWADSIDSLVWQAVYNAARRLARNAAINYKRPIAILTIGGDQIGVVRP